MVDLFTAYAILNNSVYEVVKSLNILTPPPEDKRKQEQVRLEEAIFNISERSNRLDNGVIVCHDLTQYINKFYKIHLEENVVPWIDYLIDIDEVIDLTEFGSVI